jgi:hypothetical protein
MLFGNKVSQKKIDAISFYVSWIYGTNIYHGMPYFFVCHKVFEVMNSHVVYVY